MCKRWKEIKIWKKLHLCHFIFRFYVNLLKELSVSPVKETGGKLTGENKKGQIDTIDRNILLKFSGYRKLDGISETEINCIKKLELKSHSEVEQAGEEKTG